VRFWQSNFSLLISRIGLVFSLYFFSRILFYVFNFSHFESETFAGILIAFFAGMRYDITAIVISNVLFIVLHLLPFPFFYHRIYQKILKILFVSVNSVFILLNCIDIGLFRFTGKRSGSEVFDIMSFGNDFVNTAPKMVLDFWYLLLLFGGFVFVLVKAYPELTENDKYVSRKGIVQVVINGIVVFFFGLLTFIGFRGGVQYKPLNIISASGFNNGRTSSLILNTPFTVMKTFGKQFIEENKWMSDEVALKLMPVIKIPRTNWAVRKNVVIIILESFGKEYIGSLNHSGGYTPFLDSLIGQSLTFTNAYANGKRSIEGIPAIVSGIPALMNDPFITSVYSGNTITGIASLLKTEGYSSMFFHGGTNGTMGFDNFSKLAGYDKYFGRNEYANDKDFDGNWGIYDEPFLQRSATEMNQMKAPFLATVFTLTSHHPYKIPDNLSNRFAAGTLPIHRSIRYADYALRKFFETASKMSWFDNTLFIITADHTALSESDFYESQVGMFSVPILYYCPSDPSLHGISNKTTQHIDILPSIADYVGYPKSFFAFGQSVFDSTATGFAVNYVNQSYLLMQNDYVYNLTSDTHQLFKFTEDSTLQHEIGALNKPVVNQMDIRLKAFIQNYRRSIIENKMH
jgi:hypothetical protein